MRLNASFGSASQMYWLGSYEPESTQPFIARARSARTVLDVGARDGVYSFLAANANPNAVVLAFEPNPAAFQMLLAHASANSQFDVRPLPIALSDRSGDVPFYVCGGNSSLNPGFRDGTSEVVVATRRGDDVLADQGIEGVDLIKVDTESTEPAVLLGLEKVIDRDHPEIVCEVLAGRTEDELTQFTRDHGYRVYHLTLNGARLVDHISGDRNYRNLNFLFSHPASRHSRLGSSLNE